LKDAPLNEQSSLFSYLNTGKKSITLDLKQSAGKKIFRRLVQQADIIIENLSPQTMVHLGLDYSNLRAINPRLVATFISNFGLNGPYVNWKASEAVFDALSGVTFSSFGVPGRKPLRPFGSVAQHIAGAYGAVGTMIAFYHAQKTGVGQDVDISILESITTIEEHSLVMYAYTGVIKKRDRLHPFNHPAGIYRCKDGYVQFSIGTPQHWRMLVLIAGLPESWNQDDSPFMIGSYRRQHYQEIDTAIEPWLISHTKEELQHLAKDVLIPIAAVNNISEVLRDVQLRNRQFFVELEHSYCENIIAPDMPFKTDQRTTCIKRAPLLGEHNEEIYCQRLGFSKEELLMLRGQEVI
jgi:crotonobetainyl-CoA:carnitine CoA-transferase CaiB-like acyl-CoA transferase